MTLVCIFEAILSGATEDKEAVLSTLESVASLEPSEEPSEEPSAPVRPKAAAPRASSDEDDFEVLPLVAGAAFAGAGAGAAGAGVGALDEPLPPVLLR